MQLRRQTLLAFSVLTSLLLHALLLALSPHITILKPIGKDFDRKTFFTVDLAIHESPPSSLSAEAQPDMRKGVQVESIRDLLKRDKEVTSLQDSTLTQLTDISMIEKRLALEQIFREYNLQPDEEILREIDAKLIEISQEEMRRELEIPRRLVHPSQDQLLNPDELPVLRGDRDLEYEEVAVFDTPWIGTVVPLSTPVDLSKEQLPTKITAVEQNALAPLTIDETLPSIARLEQAITRGHETAAIKKDTEKFQFLDELVEVSLEQYVPKNGTYGYFRLRIAPQKDAKISPVPKDITFIIDASASIIQRKLDRSVAGITTCIQQLRDQDLFNVVIFRDTASFFSPQSVFATPENKIAAINFLKGIQSRGQTNIYEAIRPVLEMGRREGVPGILILVSDGRPTTGLIDARNVINALTDSNRSRYSVFAFGAGNTVNRYLLELLAYRNRGEAQIISNIDDIPKELPRFVQRIAEPILVDCEIDFGRIKKEDIYPKELPDFYRGQEVTIYGRFYPDQQKEFAFRLVGKAGNQKKEIVFRQDFSQAKAGDDRIARTWAFRRIYYLIGEICRVGEDPTLLQEIRELGRKYNIRTVYD